MPPATSNPNGYTPAWSNIGHDDTGQWWGQRDGKDWVKLSPDQAQTLVRSKKPTSFETARDPARQGSVYSDVKSTLKDQLSGLLEQLEGPAWKAFKPGQTVSQRAQDVAQAVPGVSEGQNALAAIQHFMEGANPQGNGGTPARTFANRTGDLVADLLPIGLNSRRLEQDADVGNTKDILAHTGTIAGEVAAAPAVEDAVKKGLQSSLGVGDTAMNGARAEQIERARKIRADYTDKLSEARSSAIKRSAAESGATTRGALDQSSLRGPVYQRVQGMADTAVQDVVRLDSDIREFQNGQWQKLDEVAGESRVAPPEETIQQARANLKTPESIATFDRVMDKVREEAEADQGERALTTRESQSSMLADRMLKSGMSPEDVRKALLNQGYAPRQVGAIMATVPGLAEAGTAGGTVPFDQARAEYTALQRQMYGGRGLPGDVYNALKSVRDTLDANIRSSLPDGASRTFYDRLKGSYRQYMEDFYDPNGAFTKIKGAPTAVDRLNTLTGKWGKEALDAMQKYRQFNPPLEQVSRLRSLNRAIESLPSSAPAADVKMPTKEPTGKGFDVVKERLNRLNKSAASMSSLSRFEASPFGIARIPFRRLLARFLANPAVQEYLSQNPK